jgi:hypothetical protein
MRTAEIPRGQRPRYDPRMRLFVLFVGFVVVAYALEGHSGARAFVELVSRLLSGVLLVVFALLVVGFLLSLGQ